MMRAEAAGKFKLAAIDLDGTLLGPGQVVSLENAQAVRRLQESGAQVVLASGRHYNSMRKYADALPGMQWIVSCQGGELSDLPRTTVISRKFLSADEVQKAVDTGTSLGFTVLAYAIAGVFTTSPRNTELDLYARLAGQRPLEIRRTELLTLDIFKVIWLGKPEAISQAGGAMTGPHIQAVRTQERFLEWMPRVVSKAFALQALAARLGIASSEVVAFGDGDNDIPMFDWAGASVAMPHGWPRARQRAGFVAPEGPEESALARAVDLILRAP
ncbi:MAG TPA: Cof-type HAD-IIB family hydrolase [Verrucomicrobiae bacterium]|jgi:hypothetical protein|nr:Cof-type HAD-IIB family hydrolase [Verrucomicrobiae bacterium]